MVMNERISRLMDGEIDASELDVVCSALKGDDALLTWTCYHTIGDALRGESAVTPAGFAKAGEAGTMRAAQIRPLTVPADYLLAHQEYAPANALQSVGPYMRDFAASSPLRPAVAE
jgi:negative regulator of sigma E activity